MNVVNQSASGEYKHEIKLSNVFELGLSRSRQCWFVKCGMGDGVTKARLRITSNVTTKKPISIHLQSYVAFGKIAHFMFFYDITSSHPNIHPITTPPFCLKKKNRHSKIREVSNFCAPRFIKHLLTILSSHITTYTPSTNYPFTAKTTLSA